MWVQVYGGGGSQHMHGCICQRSTKMRQSDAQAGSCPSDSSTHESTQPTPAQSYGNLLPISTANCQLVPLLSSDPFCASCPVLCICLPATGGNLSIEINAHLWRAIQKSLRFSHSMHCVCLRQATEPSHFFAAKIPCKSNWENGCMC